MKKIFLILFIFSNGLIVKSQEINKAYSNAANYLAVNKRIRNSLIECKLVWPRNNFQIKHKFYKKGRLQFSVLPTFYPFSLSLFKKNLINNGFSEGEIENFSSSEKLDSEILSSLSSNNNSEIKLVFSQYKNRLIIVDIVYVKQGEKYSSFYNKSLEILFLMDEKDDVKTMYIGGCCVP